MALRSEFAAYLDRRGINLQAGQWKLAGIILDAIESDEQIEMAMAGAGGGKTFLFETVEGFLRKLPNNMAGPDNPYLSEKGRQTFKR